MQFDLLDVKNLATTFDPDQPTGDPFLDARYQAHADEFGHGVPYWRFFFHLCELLQPGLCCELGAWQGTCAAHMAPGSGTVATIDHHGDPGDDVHERLCREVQQRYSNVFYLKGWTWDRWQDVRDLGKKIDVLFVDSWHHRDKAMRDWDTYRPLLASPALVACDDLIGGEDPYAPIYGMMRFWDEVSAGHESFVSGRLHPGFPMGFFKWTTESDSWR